MAIFVVTFIPYTLRPAPEKKIEEMPIWGKKKSGEMPRGEGLSIRLDCRGYVQLPS